MLVESVQECSHAIIPQLYDTIMQTGENPRALWVKGKSLHAVRFRLKLRQHLLSGFCNHIPTGMKKKIQGK